MMTDNRRQWWTAVEVASRRNYFLDGLLESCRDVQRRHFELQSELAETDRPRKIKRLRRRLTRLEAKELRYIRSISAFVPLFDD